MPDPPLYPPTLEAAIDTAFERLHQTLKDAGPTIAGGVHAWMESMGGIDRQIAGYKHPHSYPMLLFPWWAEQAIHDPPDVGRQTDLVYSTVNGYYAIRLIDNLMDGHATAERQLLPALHVFSAEFQRVYQSYFPGDHPFWEFFHETWRHSAEVTLLDSRVDEIDLDHFMHVTARKTEAVKIPIAAVWYDLGWPGRLDAWSSFVDLFGCWPQMSNDLFDWRKDLQLGTKTYFLSEAERRCGPDEAVIGWVAREGFDWAIETLDGWMEELRDQALALGSADLLDYLDARQLMLRDWRAELAPGLAAAGKLLDILGKAEKGE